MTHKILLIYCTRRYTRLTLLAPGSLAGGSSCALALTVDIPDSLEVSEHVAHECVLIGMVALWHLIYQLATHDRAILERATYKSMYPVQGHKCNINALSSVIRQRELVFCHVLNLSSGILN